MKRLIWIGLIGCGLVSQSQGAPNAAVEEVFKVVPGDAAAFLIVQNLTSVIDRFQQSQLWSKIRQLPPVQRWQQSADYQNLLNARLLIPLYLGITWDQFRREVLGATFVFVVRKEAGGPSVGILFCKFSDEPLLAKAFEALTRELPDRKVQQQTYRDVSFFERHERDRRDCLLKLGSMAILTEKSADIRAVIDAYRNADGIRTRSGLSDAMATLDTDAVVQALLLPAALGDPRDATPADPFEAEAARTVLQVWDAMRWISIRCTLADRFELAWDIAIDEARIDSLTRRLLGSASADALFWEQLPPNTWFAVAGKFDLAAHVEWIRRIARLAPPEPDVVQAWTIARQLLAGYDLTTELIPLLGPRIAAFVAPVPDRLLPAALLAVELRAADKPGLLPVSTCLEQGLHAILVLVGIDMSKDARKAFQADIQVADGVRVHGLTSETEPTHGVEPAFAIHDGTLIVASQPEAVVRFIHAPRSIAACARARKELGSHSLAAFVNAAAIHDWLVENQSRLAARIKPFDPAAASTKLGVLISIARLADGAAIGVSRQSDRWSGMLVAWPSADISETPARP